MGVEYRKVDMADLPAIISFVDYWLSGGGKIDKIPGAGHDYFVRGGQQKAYLEKYSVMLATIAGEIVGWAVKTHKGVLIHLLVAASFQGCGIGSEMLRRMNPATVRSKSDQSTGDPAGFYRKHGYVSTSFEKLGKHKNIEMFGRAGECEEAVAAVPEKAVLAADKPQSSDSGSGRKPRRMIEIIAQKAGFGGKERS